MLSGKPLGGKAYGSIPHLPGSRRGPGDYGITDEQAAICTHRSRPGDEIIVTVKLDGSNCAVARLNGSIVAVGRAGHLAQSSPYKQHQLFADWVRKNESLFSELPNGWWLSGEWLIQAHGTRYVLNHGPFVPFDLIAGRLFSKLNRQPHDELVAFCRTTSLPTPYVLHRGGAVSITRIETLLNTPHHGELDPVEGAVWRVETAGAFNFLAKYVRPDKLDGCYLPEETGKAHVWNVLEQAQ